MDSYLVIGWQQASPEDYFCIEGDVFFCVPENVEECVTNCALLIKFQGDLAAGVLLPPPSFL